MKNSSHYEIYQDEVSLQSYYWTRYYLQEFYKTICHSSNGLAYSLMVSRNTSIQQVHVPLNY